ncbi:MAG: capsule assembly Wzi family protein [Treponema sp.]
MKHYTKYSIILTWGLFAAAALFPQEALKSTEEEYYDFLSLQGITKRPYLNYRTLSDSDWTIMEETVRTENEDGSVTESSVALPHVWQNNYLGKRRFINGNKKLAWKVYGPEWYNSFNTAAPYGQNDGALWQGRGYNTSLTAGARFEAYGLELTLKPQISFSQNMAFDLKKREVADPNANEYGYFWGYIHKGKYGGVDLPQRFGNKPFFTFDWGDTEIRYTWKTLTVGFGTENIWLGPAYLNPMLGSNNAAGYPKFDFGLRRTEIRLPWLKWYIGDIEARVWTGILTESDYFDNDSSNNYRLMNGISLSYAPSFIPGLTAGINRIFITKAKWKNLKYVGRLFTTQRLNDVYGEGEDQKIAFNASWHFPKVGFKLYGELGIDDYANEKNNPFHTAIYTVGLHQYIPLLFYKLFPNKLKDFKLDSEFMFEWNNFEMSQDFQLQWVYMGYYSHHQMQQGYTNRGQLLGAGSGHFGNSQYAAYRVYYPQGSTILSFHRFSPDNNFIFDKAVNKTANEVNKEFWANYETYITWAIESSYFVMKSLTLTGGIGYTHIYNRNYIREKNLHNVRLTLGGKYNF